MMQHRRFLTALVLLALFGFVLSPATVFASRFSASQFPLTDREVLFRPDVMERLQEQAAKSGAVPVIVRLNTDYQPEGRLANGREAARQRAAILRGQQNVLNKLGSQRFSTVKHFDFIPFLSLTVDAEGLALLQTLPEVAGIEEDIIFDATLADSVALIGATPAQTEGYTGVGQTVAILDTGVDKTHPFLAGKVVSEACYSTTNTGSGSTSLCPGGVLESTEVGSGMHCTGASGCEHGTHVAGIAAGKGEAFSGVAPDATIIAIQVYSKQGGAARALTSDVLRGLERVYALRSDFNIAAVNLSLGGGQYSATCDNDFPATKAAIDNLRSVGIATIISTGNNGYRTAVGAPACISTAVSVGSTTDGGEYATPVDTVSSFSNNASFVNLLAPGQAIYSSVPENSYALYQGTSQAAPHVAGAWAVLKSKNPDASVDQILNALSSTGLMIKDTRISTGVTRPRIRVNAALDVLPTALPEISFALSSPVQIAENQPSASFDIHLSSPVASTVTVQYETADGTARSASDYQPANGQITFLAGETDQQITISILDDSIDEVDESFTITLSSPSNAVLGANQTLQVNIQDDDPAPTMQFAASTVQIMENAGVAQVVVKLSAISEKSITVRYRVKSGDATVGEDYTGGEGTLTFTPGVIEQAIALTILDDMEFEPAEDLVLELFELINASPGQLVETEVMIVNDDPPSYPVYLPLVIANR